MSTSTTSTSAAPMPTTGAVVRQIIRSIAGLRSDDHTRRSSENAPAIAALSALVDDYNAAHRLDPRVTVRRFESEDDARRWVRASSSAWDDDAWSERERVEMIVMGCVARADRR